MHEKGLTIYGMAGIMYGAVYSYTGVRIGKSEKIYVAHELQRTESVHMNTKKRGCHEGPHVLKIKKCLEEYIEDEMQCQLPWNDRHIITYPSCRETEQYKIYLQLLKEENSHFEWLPSARKNWVFICQVTILSHLVKMPHQHTLACKTQM
jgi:hypothetical protein